MSFRQMYNLAAMVACTKTIKTGQAAWGLTLRESGWRNTRSGLGA